MQAPIRPTNSKTFSKEGHPRSGEELRHLDLRADGWVTEIVNDAAGIHFKKLNKAMDENSEALSKHLEAMIAGNFSCAPLRPHPVSFFF